MTNRTLLTHRLIIVDRDPRYAEWLRHHLSTVYSDSTLSLLAHEDFMHAIDTLSYDECDMVLLTSVYGDHPEDPRCEGIGLLREFRTRPTFPAVLVIAEEGNELTAVRALQLGAVDYLPKRLLTPDRLKTSVRLALRRIERRTSRRHAKLAGSEEHLANTAAQAAAAAEPVPADLIPGYLIRETIGESEKAVVYLAHSESLEKDVALKVTIGETNEQEHRILAREFEAVSRIRHPAVVELHDYGVHAGREYIAMDYFPRGDLKARMYQGISETEALRYVENIASALRVCHHAGILHRDLKPPNVMLRENDDVVLIDFGLARNLEGGLQSTRTGVLRGSPYYMSPEQALGEQLDARSDLYSLGIIFYEMLTGRKPFAGTSAIEVLQEHVNAPVPQLPERYSHYQPMLNRMLAKSRDERYASAEEVIEALAFARESHDRSEVSAA